MGEQAQGRAFQLQGPRVNMRQLKPEHFDMWSEVRHRSAEWLTKWEPKPIPGQPDIASDRRAFTTRCGIRDREWQLGSGYGLGLFVGEIFAGEINISNVQRGPFQNAYIGYWIDEAQAGNGYVPEGLVLLFKFAFEDLGLHRLQISIIPRNVASRRVADKLDLRNEGTALRYLEINGTWEDHVRYAITVEDWQDKRDFYVSSWLDV